MRPSAAGYAAGLAGAAIETCPHFHMSGYAREWREGWRRGMKERDRRAAAALGPDHFDAIVCAALARGERPQWGLT